MCPLVRILGRTAACALALALVALLTAASAGAQTAPVDPRLVAVNVQAAGAGSTDRAARRRDFSTLASSGVRRVRVDLPWAIAEPKKGMWNWRPLDELVLDAAAADLEIAGIVAYNTMWNRDAAIGTTGLGWLFSKPADISAFAAFAEALARRYGPQGTLWAAHPGTRAVPVRVLEIWNEQNDGRTYRPGVDPEHYGRLLLATAQRIHAVDPSLIVMVGGMNPATGHPEVADVVPFLQRALAASPGLAGQIDAVGLHVYQPNAFSTAKAVPWLRDALDALGLGHALIALNEYGAPLAPAPGGLPEPERARLISGTLERLARTDCGVLYVAPHTWRTSHAAGSTDPELSYGITRPLADGSLEVLESGRALLDRAARWSGADGGGVPEFPIHRLCGSAEPAPSPAPAPEAPPSTPVTAPTAAGPATVEPVAPSTPANDAGGVERIGPAVPGVRVRVTGRRLHLRVPRRARVRLDGRALRPASNPTPLRPGRHVLRVRAAGHRTGRWILWVR